MTCSGRMCVCVCDVRAVVHVRVFVRACMLACVCARARLLRLDPSKRARHGTAYKKCGSKVLGKIQKNFFKKPEPAITVVLLHFGVRLHRSTQRRKKEMSARNKKLESSQKGRRFI